MKRKLLKRPDGTVWSVPVREGKPKRGDYELTIYGGGYVELKRVGDPDPVEGEDLA